jgi:FlaG/FlaF family flagellin (archaellin)
MKHVSIRLAGLTAAVAVLATGGLATASATGSHAATSAVTTSAVTTARPALRATQLNYHRVVLSVLSPNEYTVSMSVPKGWTEVKLGKTHAKFTGGGNLWMVRVNGWLPAPLKTQAATAKAKIAALQGVSGIKIISTKTGTVKSEQSGGTMHYTTLTYTYRDGARGTRIVMTRWVADLPDDNGRTDKAMNEVTVSGRPIDKAGLDSLIAKTTRSLVRAG